MSFGINIVLMPPKPDLVVKTGADVKCVAKDLMVFFDGFSVESGATFTAEIKEGRLPANEVREILSAC